MIGRGCVRAAGEPAWRLIDAFVAEGVRVPFPPHVVVTD